MTEARTDAEEKPAISEVLRERLRAIDALDATIDLERRAEYTTEAGWHVDARGIELAVETAGAPRLNGPFAIAKDLLRAYKFTPQWLIRGYFDPEAPLENRPMLLRAQFLWVRFELGVRVNAVIDEERDGDAGPEHAWGYRYHTLAGHLERGEITFEVIKQQTSGVVRFRIHSFSQTGHIDNILYRIGFRVVGRYLQRRFAQDSLRNMRRMVHAQMERAPN